MPAITLTVAARQDLLSIWEYIADDNPTADTGTVYSIPVRLVG